MLTGAGLSAPAGLPLARQLLDEVEVRLDESTRPIYQAVRNEVTAFATSHGAPAPDIEAVVDALYLLKNRNRPSIGAFLKTEALLPDLAGVDSAADQVVACIPDCLQPTQPIEYLEPIAKYALHQELGIVTLNYDLLVERIAAERGVPIQRGMTMYRDTGHEYFDCYSDIVEFRTQPGIKLIKLHGSVDWRTYDMGFAANAGMRQAIYTGPYADITHDYKRMRLALVLGGPAKLRADGLFPGLWKEAYQAISTARRLIIAGYSFRDTHVNELIRRFCHQRRACGLFGQQEIIVLALSRDDIPSRTPEGRLFPHEFDVRFGGPVSYDNLYSALTEPVGEFERRGV